MKAKSSTILTGCCGIATGQAEYFRSFPCVEIDSTFYRLPKLATAARWRAAAPADFRFSLKALQIITHRSSSPTYKRTPLDAHDSQHCGHFGFNATIRWAWDQTYAVAHELQAFFVLFQSAASFTPTPEHVTNLKHFFERAKRGKLQLGWEPRGAWEPEQVESLCRELDLVHVVDPFKTKPPVTGKLQYFRLHGISGSKHRYSDAELGVLHGFCREKPTTYCFFNTVGMVPDAKRFLSSVTHQNPSR